MPALRRHILCLVSALGLLVASAASAPNAAAAAAGLAGGSPPTPQALARVVSVGDIALAPDGRQVAFTASDSLDQNLAQIWLVPTDGSAPARPFAAVGHSAHGARWSADGAQLLFLAAAQDTASDQVRLISLGGGESRAVTTEPNGVLAARWSPGGKRIAYLTPGPDRAGDPLDAAASPAGVQLKVRELDSGRTTVISPDSASIWNFEWSPDGAQLAVLATRPGSFGLWRRGYLATVHADGSGWRRLPGRADPTEAVAWSPDGQQLAYYALPVDRYTYGSLHVMDADGRSLRRLETTALRESWSGAEWTAAGLFVDAGVGVRQFVTRIDPATGAAVRLAEKWGGGFSASRSGAVAWTSDQADAPYDVYCLPATPGAAPRRLTWMNPQLAGYRFAQPQVITWTSYDGRRVEGILYLPEGATKQRPVPLVVMPHGGPSYRSSLAWLGGPDMPALFLAAHGYASLIPNPRGSTGYGEEFNALNRGDIGGGDYRDIQAGVDSLIAAGVVDGGRLAIQGMSYGGYMTAWAITQTNRYRCAIVMAGPMDFYANYAQDELAPYWENEFLGASPFENQAIYLERSPLYHIDKIKTPVLILHGAADHRVLPNQSEALYKALKERNVPVEYYLYPREGHGFREPSHQVDATLRTLGWLEKYLGTKS